MESDLSRDFDRKNDAARATRDFDRAGRSLAPSVSSTIAANAASSRESLRFFSLDRWNAKSNENLRRGLMPRSMVVRGPRRRGGVKTARPRGGGTQWIADRASAAVCSTTDKVQ